MWSERRVEGQGENEIKQVEGKTTMNTNCGGQLYQFYVVDLNKVCRTEEIWRSSVRH